MTANLPQIPPGSYVLTAKGFTGKSGEVLTVRAFPYQSIPMSGPDMLKRPKAFPGSERKKIDPQSNLGQLR